MPTGVYKRTKIYICSKETRLKLSESSKGNRNRAGKKCPHSEETKKKISENNSRYWLGKTRVDVTGKKQWLWKGDNVSYRALHSWVSRLKGKPTRCEHCGKEQLKGREIHWANTDHTYKRNLIDWIRLCRKCHSQYDKLKGLKNVI